MSTTCDLNVDWNKCPNCVRLKERIKDAEEASCAASANLDRAYAEYREDVAAGRACIATPRQRAWSSYLDDLEMEQSLAFSHWREAIDTWAASIHRHHRLHEDRQQKAEDSSKDVAVETEEMAAISKDAAVDALVNIYGGHIDKWLEALRERTHAQTDADDAHKGGCHEADPTDVPVWLLDTPNTAIARDVRQATLQGIRTIIDDLIDGGGQ